jgi:lipoyl(octanoyl) transferase
VSQYRFLSLRSSGSAIVPFRTAWELQKSLVERRAQDEIPDTVLFVEHPPTVTRGRGLQRKPGEDSPVRAMPIGPLPPGTEYFEIERGGDLTWHGPGQLVAYPIVKLEGSSTLAPKHDVTGYLRALERAFAGWAETYGLRTEAREGATGIWVLPEPARKIASIGIAVRKWVTYHGIAFNLANGMEGFRAISPCGFDPEVMTTLARESERFRARGWSPETRAAVELEIARAIGDADSSVDAHDC